MCIRDRPCTKTVLWFETYEDPEGTKQSVDVEVWINVTYAMIFCFEKVMIPRILKTDYVEEHTKPVTK